MSPASYVEQSMFIRRGALYQKKCRGSFLQKKKSQALQTKCIRTARFKNNPSCKKMNGDIGDWIFFTLLPLSS